LWSKRHGIVAGLSASAVPGAKWIGPSEPAELIHDNRRPPADLIVRTEAVLAGEIIDALANATDVKRVDVEAVMAAHPAARGDARLLRVLPLMDAGR
jgi:hypothetical protein